MRLIAVTWLVLLGVGVAARGQGGQGAPSSEELHRLVDEGKYAQALQRISAGLGLKGEAARLVDRHELYMLKGVCHLNTRAMRPAAEAFAGAEKEAGDDRGRAAVAAAHVALVKRSRGPTFTPAGRGADGKPKAAIDISTEAGRRAAFAALFEEELAANRQKLAALKGATTLGPVLDLLKPLNTLEGLETAATAGGGKPERTRALMAEAADRAKQVVAGALRELAKRVTAIDKEANTLIEFYRDTEDPNAYLPRPIKEKAYKRRGLTEPRLRELRELGGTADQVPEALAVIARGVRAEEKDFSALAEEAGRLRKDVDRLLDTDYERVFTEKDKPGGKR